ncbi:MAG TPA: hypothetical protein ENK38_02050 [Gammaproteobacteria bacterium]|nr:hypothetical protein [Gammaproteobacteria bacterium]
MNGRKAKELRSIAAGTGLSQREYRRLKRTEGRVEGRPACRSGGFHCCRPASAERQLGKQERFLPVRESNG